MIEKTIAQKEPTKKYTERVGAYGVGFNENGKIPVVRTPLYNGKEGYFYYMEIDKVVAKPTEPDHHLVWLTVDEVKEKLFLPHQIWAVAEIYKTFEKKDTFMEGQHDKGLKLGH